MEGSTQPTSAANVVDPARPQSGTQRSNSENSNFRTNGSNSSGSSGYGGKPTSSSPSTAQKEKTIEDNGTTTSMTNAVDSAYSHSNSQFPCSESSQCRMRGSNSSGSSGYGGKQTTSLSTAQAENSSGSSGNSGELTTIKNLKRSKNQGRKKKAKTKKTQNRSNQTIEPAQEAQPQDLTLKHVKPTAPIFEQPTLPTADTKVTDDVTQTAEESILSVIQNAEESDNIQKEIASDNKSTHDHNVILKAPSESLKDKTDPILVEENNSATDKSPDDLEVDNILSHSNVEHPSADQRANSIQESFCCAISMHDGVILSTTANSTDSLGFPKDVWLGRAFIDFVHPKDRPTFASQITNGYMEQISLKDDYLRTSNFEGTPLYVLLRCYRSFDTCGFALKSKPVSYKPFKLIFRKAPGLPSRSVPAEDGNSALRFICAVALSSIYEVPDKMMNKRNAKFSTRHTAGGILVHIDGTAVAAIGYMPQDILGKSVLDFFHPEDLVPLKTAYELLMKNPQAHDGRVSSPPYRFLINNGCYITMETEWTKVFNPWSRKLEFVTGDHCVLRGPNHCDIFTTTSKYACQFPNEILRKAATLKEELLKVLSEPVPYPSNSVKQRLSKRCQALASFMESLLVGVTQQELKLDLPTECEPAASEHGSVMLGEISPHHHSNHDDSKKLSATPPTYDQLNYFENLNRFFNSVQPNFVPNEFKSLPYQIDHVPTNEIDRMLSPIQQGGEESGGSFNSSSDTPQFESTNTSNTSNNGNPYQPHLLLTEAIVSRHTDQMELQMVKNHKKYRTPSSHLNDKKKSPDKLYANGNATTRNQPVKRSWPNNVTNNSKAHNRNRYTSNVGDTAQIGKPTAQYNADKTNNSTRQSSNHAMGPGNKVHPIHLLPSFSMNANTTQNNLSTNNIPNSINPFLLSNHSSAPRYFMPPMNSNSILQIDPKLNVRTTNVTSQPNVNAANLPNPYALHSPKNPMYQPQPYLNQNLAYPYPPIAYQPLPMLQHKSATTAQSSGASSVWQDMPWMSHQSSRIMPDQLSNMALFQSSEPVNLSTNANENIPKIQVKPWAKMKDQNSDEIDTSDSSFSSSFFDSQIQTDESSESDQTSKGGIMETESKKRGKIPFWMKNVKSTPDLVLRYQVQTKELDDVLQSDLKVLRKMNQPAMVNEQLNQLYLELDSENHDYMSQVLFEDSPNGSSEDDENMSKKKKNTHYTNLSMIYEENAPVQPPVEMSN